MVNAASPVPVLSESAMRQHARFAELHPGVVLLFQCDADTYLVMGDDAEAVRRVCGFPVLDGRSVVPAARMDAVLRGMILAGHRVAVIGLK